MRGNWDESEPLVLASNHHHHQFHHHQQLHQSQQQSTPPPSSPDRPPQAASMLVDDSTTSTTSAGQEALKQELQGVMVQASSSPLTTTPVWSNLVVKEEPNEEKNNDSGISPGHYTSDTASPHSDRSLPTNHCQLSPSDSINNSSAGSPDHLLAASNMHQQLMNELNHSNASNADSGAYENHHSPLDYARVMQQQNVDETSSSLPSPIEEMHSRASMSPGQVNDDDQDMEGNASLNTPLVNAQGRIKTFRCKQCTFVAITKLDFWEHTRSHIKAEKLLTCPKCPFVTEYKHHLEYHLRNHFGSKPYKCDKCSYSCVNKSMLNSHLKSHSNVYQFRCADCSYATKYCHSLKLHLRKYEHKPAMVLNADGSPNPLPIIDIYGTRRGPKTKSKKAESQAENQQQQQQQPQQQQQQQSQQPQQPAIPPQLTMPAQFQFNGFNGFNPQTGLPATVPFLGFPYNQLFGGFPLAAAAAANPFTAIAANNNNNKESNEQQQIEQLKANFLEYTKNVANGQARTSESESFPVAGFSQTMNGGGLMIKTEIEQPQQPQIAFNRFGIETKSPSPVLNTPDAVDLTEPTKTTPLDLSKPEQASPRTSTTSTNRRKGRAVRLDRRVIARDSDEEMPDDDSSSNASSSNKRTSVMPPASSPPNSEDSATSSHSPMDPTQFCEVGVSNEFVCNYCEISFGNEVMHSVHMGYHGYQNPFTCNMCGIQCTDKVSFFLHIARSKH